MTELPILVTGAAGGTQGRTGRLVAERLLKKRHRVRAFVRKRDERSDYLQSLGAEVFVGDLLDAEAVREANAGVGAVYFAYPVQEGLLESSVMMATAARDAGVKRIVLLMMLSSSPNAPTSRMRQNYISEQIMDGAGIGAIFLRAAVFYENLYSLVAQTVAMTGKIRLPWGDETTIVPLVSAEDVAQVATELLLVPDLPPGSSYRLLGAAPEVREIVATISRVLDADIGYENLSDVQWRQMALDDGINSHTVEHLSQLWRFLRMQPISVSHERFRITSEAFERFGNFLPLSLEDFFIARKTEWIGDQAIEMKDF